MSEELGEIGVVGAGIGEAVLVGEASGVVVAGVVTIGVAVVGAVEAPEINVGVASGGLLPILDSMRREKK